MGDGEDPAYIGFSCIADQYQRKTVKKGFEFTLMVVGESGLGKSTMINSLFLTDLYRNRQLAPVSDRLVKTTEIEKTTLDIEEAGVKLRLTIVDTPGRVQNIPLMFPKYISQIHILLKVFFFIFPNTIPLSYIFF